MDFIQGLLWADRIGKSFSNCTLNSSNFLRFPLITSSFFACGSDIPQEWVSNLKDQRPRSNTAKPKSDLWQSYNIGLPPVGQQNTVSFKVPRKPVPDYNDKKGKVVMINPFTLEDPSKVPVVDQLVRP